MERYKYYVDGGSRRINKIRRCGWGIVLYDKEEREIWNQSVNGGSGEDKTNNYAEWMALLSAVEDSVQRKLKNIVIYSDSMLVVKQATGEYRVKNYKLSNLFRKLEVLRKKNDLSKMKIEWVKGHSHIIGNERADQLATQGLQDQLSSDLV